MEQASGAASGPCKSMLTAREQIQKPRDKMLSEISAAG